MEKMKILYVVSDYASPKNPSFQPFVRSQIESIGRLGHDTHIYSIDGPTSGKNYITRIPDLLRFARKLKPDIVHAHYAYCGFTAMGIVSICPLITSIMGDEVLGRYTMCGRKKFFSYIQYPLAKMVGFLSSRIIVKSSKMLPHCIARKTHVIPNGVDFDLFRPMSMVDVRKQLGLDQDKVYLLFPGDPHNTVKRFELALATSHVLENEHGMANSLVHMRNKPQVDLARYMNAANAMIFTSWSEGSPNVVKEAMACNLPIVSVDVGDVKEIIGQTFNCAVTLDDPKAMASALFEIIISARRSQGRDNIQHLRIENVARRIVQLYRDTMRD
jgi:glycosyltransferase involved in cell wall biosynthesis